jgi:hypothetical protein
MSIIAEQTRHVTCTLNYMISIRFETPETRILPSVVRDPHLMYRVAAAHQVQSKMWSFAAVMHHLRNNFVQLIDTCYLTALSSLSCFCYGSHRVEMYTLESSYDPHRRTTLYAGVFFLRPSDNSVFKRACGTS